MGCRMTPFSNSKKHAQQPTLGIGKIEQSASLLRKKSGEIYKFIKAALDPDKEAFMVHIAIIKKAEIGWL